MVSGYGKRHISPAKARYDASHPTVTFRVDKAVYDKLVGLKESTGKSLAVLVKEALEVKDFTPSYVWQCWLCERSFKTRSSVFRLCKACYNKGNVEELAKVFFEAVGQ